MKHSEKEGDITTELDNNQQKKDYENTVIFKSVD